MPEKTVFQKKMAKENKHIMPVSEVIDKVAAICKANGVRRLDLFGSFATGTATATSEKLQEIDTLRKIDLFDYDSIKNEFLLEDIRKYGIQIY